MLTEESPAEGDTGIGSDQHLDALEEDKHENNGEGEGHAGGIHPLVSKPVRRPTNDKDGEQVTGETDTVDKNLPVGRDRLLQLAICGVDELRAEPVKESGQTEERVRNGTVVACRVSWAVL